mmetsp:Transcript_39482/g.88336  ORF Transcript_39482/g.88336 Transcript_39482/m.88336 type:complete len:244 (+) Transcript_39482:372-1103(+)
MKIDQRSLARKGVKKVGPIVEAPAANQMALDDRSGTGSLLSDLSAALAHAPSPPPGRGPHGQGGGGVGDEMGSGYAGLPPCPEADAVEALLSSEEAAELASFPALPGTYFDRKAGHLKLAPSRQLGALKSAQGVPCNGVPRNGVASTARRPGLWTMDPTASLQEVVERVAAEQEEELRRFGQTATHPCAPSWESLYAWWFRAKVGRNEPPIFKCLPFSKAFCRSCCLTGLKARAEGPRHLARD